MRKSVVSILLVAIAGIGLGACSGGSGTPYCNKARELTKSLGSSATVSPAQAKIAVEAYHFMANHIPSDFKDVTKKDFDDFALVVQATFIDKDAKELVGKVDTNRVEGLPAKVQAYNIKRCDIVYPKDK